MGLSGASKTSPEKPMDKKIAASLEEPTVHPEYWTNGKLSVPPCSLMPVHGLEASNSPSSQEALRSVAVENIRDRTPDALAWV
jgi:hypothetical protein